MFKQNKAESSLKLHGGCIIWRKGYIWNCSPVKRFVFEFNGEFASRCSENYKWVFASLACLLGKSRVLWGAGSLLAVQDCPVHLPVPSW